MPGDGDDRKGAARAGADVRAVGVPERFDDRGGFERATDGQVVDQRQASMGQNVHPSSSGCTIDDHIDRSS